MDGGILEWWVDGWWMLGTLDGGMADGRWMRLELWLLKLKLKL